MKNLKKTSGPKCIETENGNLLICFPIVKDAVFRTFYFFADKNGKPMNGAAVDIWSNAKRKWKKPILALPENLQVKAEETASKLHDLAERKLLAQAPYSVFGKEIEPKNEKVINKPHVNNQLAEGLQKARVFK